VLHGLERIAPVTAVEGNCDCNLGVGQVEVLLLGGFKIVLRHVSDARFPGAEMREVVSREKHHASSAATRTYPASSGGAT
jgi:predicted phosphodiesterase